MHLQVLILGLFLLTCEPSSNLIPTGESCTEDIDCLGVCGGSAVCDVVCDVSESNCIVLGLSLNVNVGLDVTYNSNAVISGFQFVITGITVLGASGGDAETAGFSQSYSSSSGMVLGFGIGTEIPAGNGVLTNIEFEGSGEVCISPSSPLFADPGSVSIDVELGDCLTII